jgi:hypothetical protein
MPQRARWLTAADYGRRAGRPTGFDNAIDPEAARSKQRVRGRRPPNSSGPDLKPAICWPKFIHGEGRCCRIVLGAACQSPDVAWIQSPEWLSANDIVCRCARRCECSGREMSGESLLVVNAGSSALNSVSVDRIRLSPFLKGRSILNGYVRVCRRRLLAISRWVDQVLIE